jgi:hypothetical protein
MDCHGFEQVYGSWNECDLISKLRTSKIYKRFNITFIGDSYGSQVKFSALVCFN